MSAAEAGHVFLARMGKTRLRPGGREATEWLLSGAGLGPESSVLEVACNMGTTAIEIARRFGCRIVALDRDDAALEKARANIAAAGLAHLISIREGSALELPFADASFDVVVNEAMLTMYATPTKERLVAEYLRVLKPGGRLLTHDVMLADDAPSSTVDDLRAAIHVSAQPLTGEGWTALFRNTGFTEVETLSGPMSLLSLRGMIRDEGLPRTLRILRNALRPENRAAFVTLFRTFRHHRRHLRFVSVRSHKSKP